MASALYLNSTQPIFKYILPQFCCLSWNELLLLGLKYTFYLLHFTSLHFTSLHFTSLHFTSLHFTSLHFTSLHFTSLHFTSLHFTSLSIVHDAQDWHEVILNFSFIIVTDPINEFLVDEYLLQVAPHVNGDQFAMQRGCEVTPNGCQRQAASGMCSQLVRSHEYVYCNSTHLWSMPTCSHFLCYHDVRWNRS